MLPHTFRSESPRTPGGLVGKWRWADRFGLVHLKLPQEHKLILRSRQSFSCRSVYGQAHFCGLSSSQILYVQICLLAEICDSQNNRDFSAFTDMHRASTSCMMHIFPAEVQQDGLGLLDSVLRLWASLLWSIQGRGFPHHSFGHFEFDYIKQPPSASLEWQKREPVQKECHFQPLKIMCSWHAERYKGDLQKFLIGISGSKLVIYALLKQDYEMHW